MHYDRIHIQLATRRPQRITRVAIGDAYVEEWWTPILGPSAVAVLRHVARHADTYRVGAIVGFDELARRFGLSGCTHNSALARTLNRLNCYQAANWIIGLNQNVPDLAIEIYDTMPILAKRHTERLTEQQRARHEFDAAAITAEVTQ